MPSAAQYLADKQAERQAYKMQPTDNLWQPYGDMCRDGVEWRISPQLVDYPLAVAVMEARVEAVLAGTAPELVWLLEHPPMYTAGTSAEAQELLTPNRFPVYASGRGGHYTYHGPGQRVIYVISDLRRRGHDLKAHVWRLEELVIRALCKLGVQGERRIGRTGVWVTSGKREAKIAAIGVRARRWVTFHGVAINVCPNLGHFSGIIPCGLPDYEVTSLAALGWIGTMEEVDRALWGD